MKRMPLSVITFFFYVFSYPAFAQESLTNDSVIKLVRAGLSEDLIVQTVNSQPGKYALGADDIVALKRAGISDKIIGAMLRRNDSASGKAAAVGPEVSSSGYPPRSVSTSRKTTAG